MVSLIRHQNGQDEDGEQEDGDDDD